MKNLKLLCFGFFGALAGVCTLLMFKEFVYPIPMWATVIFIWPWVCGALHLKDDKQLSAYFIGGAWGIPLAGILYGEPSIFVDNAITFAYAASIVGYYLAARGIGLLPATANFSIRGCDVVPWASDTTAKSVRFYPLFFGCLSVYVLIMIPIWFGFGWETYLFTALTLGMISLGWLQWFLPPKAKNIKKVLGLFVFLLWVIAVGLVMKNWSLVDLHLMGGQILQNTL